MPSPKFPGVKVAYAAFALLFLLCGFCQTAEAQKKRNKVIVDMVALDQPFLYNRIGAAQPTGMIFALKRDIVSTSGATLDNYTPGEVRLRDGKRARPIVLRCNKGDIIEINFTNLLAPYDATGVVDAYGTNKPATVDQQTLASGATSVDGFGIYPATRAAGVHISGTSMESDINSDASWAGANGNSLANPGESKTYTIIAEQEGAFMLYSMGADVANGGIRGGQLSSGLFGSLNVQPEGAEWYRSQVSEADLYAATKYYENPNSDPEKPNVRIQKAGADRSNLPGFPIIDYDYARNGVPVIKMYTEKINKNGTYERTLVHTDLTAIITGPDAGMFPYNEDEPSFFNVPASPNRRQAYREFAIHYHEAPFAVQAFNAFYDPNYTKSGNGVDDITSTLQGGYDQFAINYGTGGIGAEIFANRIGAGPMSDCIDCVYEEFFLSSWPCGDPASIVDIPANSSGNTTQDAAVTLQNQVIWQQDKTKVDAGIYSSSGHKATKVLYPDDPSNVYHSYMNDHVKFRVNHAGAGITHVHHQHAHQWLHTPNSDNGHYLDSQTINPGSSYTLEMVYHGSGNLNKTVGDQIFHCHFYPHFAQGMWALWRVHDVFEAGTELDSQGRPKRGSRALPDGEISRGTPIPGLVPIPTVGMAPIPGKVSVVEGQVVVEDDTKNPGYPFFIPGVAGSRAPHPPMDFAVGDIYDEDGNVVRKGELNGGLPRTIVVGGDVLFENHNKYDWTKTPGNYEMIQLPEAGTPIEKLAMATHAKRTRKSITPKTGEVTNFDLNGMPPVPGAPYANPAVDIQGNAVGTKRIYKAANIQTDLVLNKSGWHYPQGRIITLWEDVAPTISGQRPPEPFFFRANTDEYIEFWHTNLVPEYYELDDFQVRTPTDIIGQHIHLVKFDVTSSDGAANGWNYEDGTFSPETVVDRIEETNNGGKRYIYQYKKGAPVDQVANYKLATDKLEPHYPNPVWGDAPAGQSWKGAQTTIQLWYADPLLNNDGQDRTLRTVFTHDHFSPSTHQQVGLYAGLLVEPQNSKWIDPMTGVQMGTRDDGGPTSWQANIVTQPTRKSYREFMFEFQDTQLGYFADSRAKPDPYPVYPYDNPQDTTKYLDSVAAYRGWIDNSQAISPPAYGGFAANPQPNVGIQLVSTGGTMGTYSANYRNEPVPLRVSDTKGKQASGQAGDLAYAFSSLVDRANPAYNVQPTGGDTISDSNDFTWPVDPLSAYMQPTDPYTPLLNAYENDRIQIRYLVGAHVNPHMFTIHGAKWLFGPSNKNSGWKSAQMASISEHFEMNFTLPSTENSSGKGFSDYLYKTSSDMHGMQGGNWGIMRAYDMDQAETHPEVVPLPNNSPERPAPDVGCGCPEDAPVREFTVTALSIDQYNNASENGGALMYNINYNNLDPNAVVFVLPDDINDFKNTKGFQIQPLIMRANAGECIKITLKNEISSLFTMQQGAYSYGNGPTYNLVASSSVGLNTQLLSYDVSKSDGTNVGFNKGDQTASIGNTVTYEWYAGMYKGRNSKPVPVEFGSVILDSPDPLEQYIAGLFGALIIEPAGATWDNSLNTRSRAQANINDASGNLLFRECVLIGQDNLNVTSAPSGNNSGGNTAVNFALNYKSALLPSRYNNNGNFNAFNIENAYSNSIVGNYPETPHFVATKGKPVRFRLLHTGGARDGDVFTLHGHVWQELPYRRNSTVIGYNPQSQWIGARGQLAALNSFDAVIRSAGGPNGVIGDYLYNSFPNLMNQGGNWGIFIVTNGTPSLVLTSATDPSQDEINLIGSCTDNPTTGAEATQVTLLVKGKEVATASVQSGYWTFKKLESKKLGKGFTIQSDNGGSRVYDFGSMSDFVKQPLTDLQKNAPTSSAPDDGPRNPGVQSDRDATPEKVNIHK